jgi:hypothetical protein
MGSSFRGVKLFDGGRKELWIFSADKLWAKLAMTELNIIGLNIGSVGRAFAEF